MGQSQLRRAMICHASSLSRADDENNVTNGIKTGPLLRRPNPCVIIDLSSVCPRFGAAERYVKDMKNNEWISEMHQKDSELPNDSTTGEPAYTLFLRDLLAMPDVNFTDLAKIDPAIRSLLN
jgi:hypothetical protein